jgi:hypothetical protein
MDLIQQRPQRLIREVERAREEWSERGRSGRSRSDSGRRWSGRSWIDGGRSRWCGHGGGTREERQQEGPARQEKEWQQWKKQRDWQREERGREKCKQWKEW